ncbi:hypothetical protein [Lutibacter sp.]|uniref:hypothetical protein n=1 Tax=Lutibacter sp. TaxID=1925666 RepID=UPI0025B7EF9E|nr:hypothetical protein [Lutibacter sp.]MCF6168001.1 hypothetical protein [Lutibacter sp.]
MEELINRVNETINLCWDSFCAKVGGGLINVNKEASMQLNFAYILKNSIDLVIYEQDEEVSIELETGIPINGKLRECDIVVKIEKGKEILYLPIEMKCHKYLASSGKPRGAQDLFKFGVYEDLELLESYVDKTRLLGIQLTMTNSRNFVFPKRKNGKSWDYDISDGIEIKNGIELNTPIGGNPISLKLTNSYTFKWNQVNEFYFLKLQGKR